MSVVVPVRNRRDLLAELLDSLDVQTYRDFEVIVVDDGSTDGTPAVAEGRTIANRPVLLLRSPSRGAVVARCAGVALASGEILAFTDSDCKPQPGWMAAGVSAIEAGAGIVNGLTRPQRPTRPFERSVGSGMEGLYPSCNLFFRRQTFDDFGGFPQDGASRLGFRLGKRASGLGFGEDTILAWRMRRAGVPCTFAPECVVEHYVFPPDLHESLSRSLQAAAFPALIREVPELRRTLLHRSLFLGGGRLPLYGIMATLLLGKRRAGAGFAVWWLGTAWRDVRSQAGSWSTKLPWLPAEMAVDVITTGALVVGSIRAGSLVL